MIDFSVSCIKKIKCNVNEFVHWNYNDAQIRMITYLCHDLEIDVKGFSLVDNDKGEIASLHKSRRCKNLIASLPILSSKDC